MKAGLIPSFIRWIVILAVISPLLSSCGGGGGGGGDPAVENVREANLVVAENAFTATLSGAQEVRPNASTAIGAGTAIVDPDTRRLTATIVTAGIGAAGATAHIHDSSLGFSDPIAFTMTETAPGSGTWSTQVTLSETQLNALRSGGYSFRVSSAAFPEGEIRGPILPRLSTPRESGIDGTGTTAAATTSATVFKNALTGTQVVPPVVTAAVAIGTAAVDHIARTLTVAINSTGIAGIEAHVHEAEPGANGPLIFPLTQASAGSGIWFARVSLSDAQLSSLLAGNMYFDIHTAAFPAGELRGQILELHRRTRLHDCRFGGFGFDSCGADGGGLFVGFGVGGILADDFGTTGFDDSNAGFDDGSAGLGGGTEAAAPDSAGSGSDSPSPGFFF